MDIIAFLKVFFVIVTTLFGIIIGSFLNVVIYRVPEGRTISKGHSMCMSCGHTLGALDLVPVFSWLFLGGKCRYCRAPVSSRYIKIETFTGLVFLIIGFTFRDLGIFPLASGAIQTTILLSIVGMALLLLNFSIMISTMMIYHDVRKCYKIFPILSICCTLLFCVINSFIFNRFFRTAIYFGIFFVLSLLLALIVFSIFCLTNNSHTFSDFCFDFSNLFLIFSVSLVYIGKINHWLTILFSSAAIFYIVLRVLSKKIKKIDEYVGIINVCMVVILFLLVYIYSLYK